MVDHTNGIYKVRRRERCTRDASQKMQRSQILLSKLSSGPQLTHPQGSVRKKQCCARKRVSPSCALYKHKEPPSRRCHAGSRVPQPGPDVATVSTPGRCNSWAPRRQAAGCLRRPSWCRNRYRTQAMSRQCRTPPSSKLQIGLEPPPPMALEARSSCASLTIASAPAAA